MIGVDSKRRKRSWCRMNRGRIVVVAPGQHENRKVCGEWVWAADVPSGPEQ